MDPRHDRVVSQTGAGSECNRETDLGAGLRPYGLSWSTIPSVGDPDAKSAEERNARTVLVVDDEPGFRSLVRDLLESVGYQVLEAADGKQAVEVRRDHRIDILITDLAMPDVDGIELIRTLVQTRRAPQVIAISGAFEQGVLNAARLLGAQAALTKPIDVDHLLRLVDGLAGF